MTIAPAPLATRPPAPGAPDLPAEPASAAAADGPALDAAGPGEATVNPLLVGAMAALSTTAVGWMFAGVFGSGLARVVGVAGALLGVGLATFSYRLTRPALLQYLSAPIFIAAGALIVLPFAPRGNANLVSLVIDAVRSGGISHPPVPFDPGWRFILLLLVALIGATATMLAVHLGRSTLAIMLPAPLIFLGALVQPPSSTLLSAVVTLVLFVAAFGVSYGADLAREGASSRQFERRRAIRAAAVLLALAAAVVAVSQTGFLLPKTTNQAIIPPEFPQIPPPTPDHPLFTVSMSQPMPLRLGVLDVYRNTAWLTPPFNPARLQTVPDRGRIRPNPGPGNTPPLAPAALKGNQTTVAFTITGLTGHLLPDVANPLAVSHQGFTLQYDPRTQELRLPSALASSGMRYTVSAAPLPTAGQLQSAGSPPASMRQYLAAPPPPPSVAALLAKAPTANLFERLQYVRNVYYQHVVASGPGNPVPVPPGRVAALLAGKPGSPFEIVAGEVLLARWAGVPARLGYGYYATTPVRPGSHLYSISPIDGAVWLEAYFAHYGWVPIVGTPPKAQANLDTKPKKVNPTIVPSSRLSEVIYVPVKLASLQALYTIILYWLVRVLPIVIAGLLGLLFYPGLLKLLRRQRRRRWAASLPERLAVAYAELRDGALDMNLADGALTPLEFADTVAEDQENLELAWLVTRALWADLARDLRSEDVDIAEDLARSVLRRLRRATPTVNRIVAFGSRVSLREPYTQDIPNLWFRLSFGRRLGAAAGRLRSATRSRQRSRRVPRTVAALAAMIGLGGCAAAPPVIFGPGPALPRHLAPAQIGGVVFHEQPNAEAVYAHAGPTSLVSMGKVYSLNQDGQVQGDVQIAAFKPQYSGRLTSVKQGVLSSLGGNSFQLDRIGPNLVYVAALQNEQLLLWFAPSGRYYVLMDAQASFGISQSVLLSLLSYQRGGSFAADTGVAPLDPRQGGDY